MENNKKPRGGARPNAGRKKIEGRVKTALIVTEQTNVLLSDFAKSLNVSKNRLADILLFNALHRCNPDFLFCKCGRPVCFLPTISVKGTGTFKCICGEETEHEFED